MNASYETENSTWILDNNFTDLSQADEFFGPKRNVLSISLDVLTIFITYTSMFFMGCDVEWSQIQSSFKYWKYLLLGMAGQFVLMPACGFLAISMWDIKDYYAAGITIVTCSPGGGYSNLLTYLHDGEVWLSVVLTTLSSVMAFGIVPLNLWIYTGHKDWSVPYLNMLIVLILLSVAFAIGMAVKWKIPTKAELITKGGVAVNVTAHFLWLVIWFLINPTFFKMIPWKLGLAVLTVMVSGLISISLIAQLLSYPISVIKTLAIETLYQSIGVALTVSIITFQRDVLLKVQTYIFLYLVSTATVGLFSGGLYQLVKSCKASPFFGKKTYLSVKTAPENTSEDNKV